MFYIMFLMIFIVDYILDNFDFFFLIGVKMVRVLINVSENMEVGYGVESYLCKYLLIKENLRKGIRGKMS